MSQLGIRDRAILVGFDAENRCVYSESLSLFDYYEGEHVWDDDESVRRLKLRKLKGYLFDFSGILEQEFETRFDADTGEYSGEHVRFADGTTRTNGEP
jgi:hypothetical protein